MFTLKAIIRMSNPYYFHADNARLALEALAQRLPAVQLSVDLNRTEQCFALSEDALLLEGELSLDQTSLKRIAKKSQKIFLYRDGELEVLEHRGEGYYKLVPTEGAPLLEISGVKMHISKGTDPYTSAAGMAKQAVCAGDRVLDCCSGLGYAAIAAHRLGAREVVTIELSPEVVALRAQNPWSQALEEAGITQLHGSSYELVPTLPSASFDAIIHDPPRFSLAGELYSEAFYRELHRVLRPGGRLFHYTGNPHLIKKGSGFVDGALRRLKSAGFKKLTKVDHLMGISAQR